MAEKRSSFTGKLGFVLAAAGSAVGLGNIWRFPYLAARHGGGMFLLVYVILAITFGFALMCAEIALGRKTGQSAINAYGALCKKYAFIGWLSSVIPAIILPYYSVIGGWVCKYFTTFVSGGAADAAADGFFDSFIAQPFEPLFWFFVFIGITALVVLFGVEKGIETVSKWMMPLLAVLTAFVAIYGLFMPGALEGLVYYIKPDFSHFSVTTVVAAMGQLFYSMSIAMGILITYGSYMKKDVHLESSVKQIEWFDTGIAFMAGLMIVPSVFAFSGGDQAALNKGPGLMFVTLPKVFDSMAGGTLVGAVFFLLVFFAALTSSISLMETIVSILHDKLHWGRKKSALAVLLFSLLLGIPCSLGFGVLDGVSVGGMTILDICDFVSNNLMMPIAAILTCWFVGYVIKPQTLIEEMQQGGTFKRQKMFTVMIRYIAPICIVLILISSLLEVFGYLHI